MRTSADLKRGSFIALMFAVVLFGLIPEYVPRLFLSRVLPLLPICGRELSLPRAWFWESWKYSSPCLSAGR